MLVSLRRPRAAVHFEPDVFLCADDSKSKCVHVEHLICHRFVEIFLHNCESTHVFYVCCVL